MASTKRLEVNLSQSIKPDSPDTGFLTKDNSVATGTVISATVCLFLVSLFIIKKMAQRMEKQPSFSVSKKRWLVKILPVFIVAGFLSFFALWASKIIFAEENDPNLNLNVSELTTLDADILGTDNIAYVKDTITLAEDSPYGYTIYLSANDTKLVNAQNPNSFFVSQSAPGTLTNNTFGFSTEAPDDNRLNETIWNPIHLDTDRDVIKVVESDEPVRAGEKIDIYYAVRSSDLEAGTYGINLTYAAIVDSPIPMQGMSSDFCSNSMEIGVIYNFVDLRDNKKYTASKYADGNCWMNQNLDLDLSTGKALTPKDSDVNTDWLPNSNTTTDEVAWEYGDGECFSDNSCEARSYDSGEHKDGNFYNAFAATAGTVAYDNDNEALTSGTASICPSGWFLATEGYYRNLIEKYNIKTEEEYGNPEVIPHFTKSFAGFYDGAGEFSGEPGYIRNLEEISISFHWALPEGYMFIQYNNEGRPQSYVIDGIEATKEWATSFGLSVRCIANFDKTVVKYDANIIGSADNVPETEIVTDIENHKAIVKISDKIPEYEDYTFIGWSTSPIGEAEYQPGDTVEVEAVELMLYAIWRAPRVVAVLGDNGNLNLLYNSKEYIVGNTYTDNIGETRIEAVRALNFDLIRDKIITINIDESFKKYKPVNMTNLFSNLSKLTTITNPENFDTSNVTSMAGAFIDAGSSADSISLDLSSWDTSNVTNMSHTFYGAGFNAETVFLDLTGWDVSNVTDMSGLFKTVGSIEATDVTVEGLSDWDVSRVVYMSEMFYGFGGGDAEIELGIENWNTNSLQSMQSMFYGFGEGVEDFSLDLSNWDVSKVTSMLDTFRMAGQNSSTFDLNLSGWDASNVTTMRSMFDRAGFYATTWQVEGVSGWDASKVESMNNMFFQAGHEADSFSLDLSDWDVRSVISMSGMFGEAGKNSKEFSVNLSDWKTDSLKDMSGMFSDAGPFSNEAATFFVDLTNWDTSKVEDMSSMFERAGLNATEWSVEGIENWQTDSVTSMSQMFRLAGMRANNFSFDLSKWDMKNVEQMTFMFESAGELSKSFSLNLNGWNIGKVTNLDCVFQSAGETARTFLLDVTGWDTSAVTIMTETFDGINNGMLLPAGETTEFILKGITSWDTSNVTDMTGVFRAIGRRTREPYELDLSSWDTAKVENMSSMFQTSDMLKIIYVSDQWSTQNVTNSENMFKNASRLVGHGGTKYNSANVDSSYARIDTAVYDESGALISGEPGYFTDIKDKPSENREEPLGAFNHKKNDYDLRIYLLVGMMTIVSLLLFILALVELKERKDSRK